MNYIEKKLEKRREDISFIQIKNDSPLVGKDYNIANYPLPILTSSLIQEVKSNQAEEIELEKIIDGIIFLLGVGDSDFPYIDQYRSLLKRVSPEIEEIIFFRAMKIGRASCRERV